MTEDEKIREEVRRYYGEILGGSDDLSTDACACASAAPPKYVIDALKNVDDEIIAHFYGCGSPIPPALKGATVLDLGCGTGRDVYVASQLAGPAGHVIGIDMTPSQLEFARRFESQQMRAFGYGESNVEFVEGFIEDMYMIADDSVDVVISNCVVNLSPFKKQLFKEVFRVLKPGGELYFSDVFCDRRVPEGFYDDPILRGECLSGAMYIEDFRRMLADYGVKAFYDVAVEELHIGDFRIATKLGCATFYSHTVRAVKSPDLEDREENYGQTATYLGTLPENGRYFDLTDEVRLIKDRPVAISGNMATMLTQSRYAPHFRVAPRGEHIGRYDYEQAQHALKLSCGREEVGLRELDARCEKLGIEPFDERVHDGDLLKSATMETMQVNVGYACNLACSHCYLSCSPKRDEVMTRETMEACLAAFEAGGYRVLDVTGGSPEMNPNLEWFLDEGSKIAEQVIVRSNLTILAKPEFAHFKDVYVRDKVKIVCSLPYYDEQYCDIQRGKGVFKSVIEQLRGLNGRGYGRDPELQIDLVYNVDGPFLPPDQRELEEFYAYQLKKSQGVEFNALYAFNNFTLGRFAARLDREQKMDYYLKLLADNYNGAVVAHMMCRTQVNVDWDGRLYDCECNHVLGLPIEEARNVRDIVSEPLPVRHIRTNPICYSCAAGSGSSCGGSLMDKVAFR
ncbi:MAG: arsenosugar biosynthesis radical SAM protein ArsS, partial [Eggerthellaceae bacterium]|nr:arsenosugar biosynthesis radical SAM protein ArsS [Eggerthellaceae bacterium]